MKPTKEKVKLIKRRKVSSGGCGNAQQHYITPQGTKPLLNNGVGSHITCGHHATPHPPHPGKGGGSIFAGSATASTNELEQTDKMENTEGKTSI